MLRQYMPKGTDLSAHTAEDLAGFAGSLNSRPHKTLGYMKPAELLAEFLDPRQLNPPIASHLTVDR